jgi:hypothetical protein
MTPVVKAVKLTVGGGVGVIGGSFATQTFTVAGSFNAGILGSEPGKYITQCVSLFNSPRVTTLSFVKACLSIGTLGCFVMAETSACVLS